MSLGSVEGEGPAPKDGTPPLQSEELEGWVKKENRPPTMNGVGVGSSQILEIEGQSRPEPGGGETENRKAAIWENLSAFPQNGH